MIYYRQSRNSIGRINPHILSLAILLAPHQFFFSRKPFTGQRERTFSLAGFEKRRYLIFPAPLECRKILVPLRFSHEHPKTCACHSLCSFMFRSESAPAGKRFAPSGRPKSHFLKQSLPHPPTAFPIPYIPPSSATPPCRQTAS